MAYVDDNEDQKKQQGQAQTSTNETVLSAPTAMASTSATPASQPNKATSSGSFTNLQKYVTANEGNDAAMGADVTNTVQGKANETNKGIEGWQKAAADTINKGANHLDQGTVNALGSSPSAVTQEQYNSATRGYAGPNAAQDIDGYGDVKQQISSTQDYADRASSDNAADRKQVLEDSYAKGGKSYTGGMSSLDNYILGAGSGGKSALKNISSTFGNYGATQAAKIDDSTKSQIAAAKTESDNSAQAVRKAATDAYGKINNKIADTRSNLAAEEQAATSAYDKLTSDLSSQDAATRQAAYKQLGIDAELADYAASKQGAKLSDLVTRGSARGLGDVLGQDDQATYANLSKLLGVDPSVQFTKGGDGKAFNIQDGVKAIEDRAREGMKADADRAAREAEQARADEAARVAAAKEEAAKNQTPILKNLVKASSAPVENILNKVADDQLDKFVDKVNPIPVNSVVKSLTGRDLYGRKKKK